MFHPKSYYFRANVAALIVKDDQVLVFQRKDYPETWQCAQGGYDVGEELVDAVWREVQEETSLTNKDLTLVAEYPEWLTYVYTNRARFKDCIGQTQKWFLFNFTGDESHIVLDQDEFIDWKWMTFEEVCMSVVEAKKPVYAQLGEWLRSNNQ